MDLLKTGKMKNILESSFEEYWIRIFNIVEDQQVCGKVIKKNNDNEIKELKAKIKIWEKNIITYCEELKPFFQLDLFDEDDDERYEYQEFKDNIFAERLWTVKSALKNAAFDLELRKYREQFLKTTAADIFITVRNILKSTIVYVNNIAKDINYNRVGTIEQLKVDYLNEDAMLLAGVIGLGIRSEMLHRLYPGNFSIMTRRSLWGMYFLSEKQEEFITDEQSDDGRKQRTSHNWEYEYDRFLLYNNFIANLFEGKLIKYGIKMKGNLRFGYVNMFLNDIARFHKDEIAALYQWEFEV